MKKNIFRTITVISYCLLVIGFTGCKDSFLEVTSPTDTFIDEYYTSKASLDEALVAAYAPLHWYDYGSTSSIMP